MKQSLLILIAVTAIFVLGLASLAFKFAFQKPPETPRVTITVPEGATVSDINTILHENKVISTSTSLSENLEGYLFPDTYEFFLNSSLEVVETRFEENFDYKVSKLFPDGVSDEELRDVIIVASLIEKEVPLLEDRKIVSGIIEARLGAGIPLQIDASICYIKEKPCLPITEDDKKIESMYNTYLHRGLPPGPIGNPGLDAIVASIKPQQSPYLYYISDPESGRTIFATTLDEHNSNVVKYLGY